MKKEFLKLELTQLLRGPFPKRSTKDISRRLRKGEILICTGCDDATRKYCLELWHRRMSGLEKKTICGCFVALKKPNLIRIVIIDPLEKREGGMLRPGLPDEKRKHRVPALAIVDGEYERAEIVKRDTT